jgi:hypothetical protein
MRLRPWDRPNTRLDRMATERGESNQFDPLAVESHGVSTDRPSLCGRDVPPKCSRNRTVCQRGPGQPLGPLIFAPRFCAYNRGARHSQEGGSGDALPLS